MLALNRAKPRILIVSPEISALPPGMGDRAATVAAKAGGMADVSAGLVAALLELGADVHVAMPHYRKLFHVDVNRLVNGAFREYQSKLTDTRIHLAEDRLFYYQSEVYGYRGESAFKVSIVFQREIINNILPSLEPDLIHCHDWMTGLIPAAARRLGIPCLFTLHNIHTYELTLRQIEESGIDVGAFWRHLYYTQMPGDYEETRRYNRVDPLASGIFAAHYMNTVSPTFLKEILDGYHDSIPQHVREQIRQKVTTGCGAGILNAPSSRYNPLEDPLIERCYAPEDHPSAKAENKLTLQHKLGLHRDKHAPFFYWPSRLDACQKGCEVLASILREVVEAYRQDGLQVAFIADGPFQPTVRNIVTHHCLGDSVAVFDFDEELSHLAFAAADFILMPSHFEPCGLPQMIGSKYGALPIVHDTGGLHDTVQDLDVEENKGNGFVYTTNAPGPLGTAIDRAMHFYRLPSSIKQQQISRIMKEAATQFSHGATARNYFDLYERMLKQPLVNTANASGGYHDEKN